MLFRRRTQDEKARAARHAGRTVSAHAGTDTGCLMVALILSGLSRRRTDASRRDTRGGKTVIHESRRPRDFLVAAFLLLFAGGCGEVWNDPYPLSEAGKNIFYSAFIDRPKHLDPAQSYTEDEYTFITQIYRPPLQYHYLKRPYALIPDAAETVPEPEFYDAAGRRLPNDAPAGKVAESVYELRLKPGVRYQPHPAFAVDANGAPLYLGLTKQEMADKFDIADFPVTGTRDMRAEDYIYQIKRLAHPRVHSPIFGMMADRIVGLRELGAALARAQQENPGTWLDLDAFPLEGVTALDDRTWRIRIKGRYPQFVYWLAMPFFSPVPREADRFFSQSGMAEKNLTLDWWPVGSGPYMLTGNDPNRRMVLTRNPNYRGETYPCEGEAGDAAAGLLEDCGKSLPFIEQAVFTREKESIPYWNKFLQGYYDISGIASDNFDQAVQIDAGGDVALSDDMRARGIRLLTAVRATTFYMGVNMLDPMLGGLDTATAKLRQALGIAIDQEEFIAIFLNGRGIPGMSPLPPGVFGAASGMEGVNSRMYDWRNGAPRRKSITEARRLLAEAGWPNGRNAKTGEPLVVNLDTTVGGMGDKAHVDWLTRQFRKIDVQLVVRASDYNRFQDKLKESAAQLFFLGWNADYPDPENFFFLLHGPENQKNGGENKVNYQNPEFDRLFLQMKSMDNTPERLALIRRMNRLLQHDAPWIALFHPKTYTLTHGWLKNRKPNDVANNTLKYQRLDYRARERQRAAWNTPERWPLAMFAVVLALLAYPAFRLYRQREGRAGKQACHEKTPAVVPEI
ncbi:MAG: ABC transporter substrate-binding protein [Zoogloeaceae bacterium]|jgi:ABC-type transport system substrate-binding protein|nr:ABC transporter substrate-binding protein [Zoogloeaceae bacterium]